MKPRHSAFIVASFAIAFAVGDTTRHVGGSPSGPERQVAPAEREWEVRERQVERFRPRGQSLQAIGFGSGGSITTVVLKSPRAIYQFDYFSPTVVTGGLARWWEPYPPGMLQLTAPTDVVGVTSDGIPLYLDASTATVKTSTISAQRVLVIALDSTPAVQSACALDARTFAFVESSRPDTVFLRSIGQRTARRVALVPRDLEALPTPWSTVRLDGSMGAGCALWAPTWPDVVTIADSTVHPQWSLPFRSSAMAWPTRLLAWLRHRDSRPVIARDVTVFPGGVAVLSASGDGVDLYSMDRGVYLETIALPRPALRITGAGPRLFVLSQAQDTVRLASYVLPENARALAPHGGLPRIPPPPPAWLRALRRKSW